LWAVPVGEAAVRPAQCGEAVRVDAS